MGINLLPSKKQKKARFTVICVLCFVLALAAGTYFAYEYYLTLKEQAAELGELTKDKGAELAQVHSIIELNDNVDQLEQQLTDLRTTLKPAMQRINASTRFAEVRAAVPDTILIGQMRFNFPGEFRFQGTAPTVRDVASLIEELEAFDYLANPAVVYLRKSEMGLQFELKFDDEAEGDQS